MAQDAKGKEVGVAGRGETARGQEQVSLLFDKLLNFVCNRSEIYSIHNFYLTTIQTCWLTILYKNINDAKKTLKKNEKWCSNARTFSSNFWVLWQPPIGNVTPYFRGLVPYGSMSHATSATRKGTTNLSAPNGLLFDHHLRISTPGNKLRGWVLS